jgi:hypothetical protein
LAWLELPQLILYITGLAGCSWLAWRLMTARFSAQAAPKVGRAMCVGAVVGGLAITVVVIPDWNPIAFLWLFTPYLSLAIWALYFSVLVSRGDSAWGAARRAVRWTIPSMLVLPVVILVLILVLAR